MIINDPRKEKESSSIWRAPFYPACRILCGLSLSRQSKMHRIPHVHQDFFYKRRNPSSSISAFARPIRVSCAAFCTKSSPNRPIRLV